MTDPSTPTPPPLVSHPPAPPIENSDRPPHIVDDKLAQPQPCVQCSYDLMGLRVDGQCPECSLPVAESLRGKLLQYASREYRAALLLGTRFVYWGTIASLGMIVLGIAMSTFIGSMRFRFGSSRVPTNLTELAGVYLTLIPTACILLGYWLITKPDPQFAASEAPAGPRSLLRWAAAVQLAAAALGAVVATMSMPAAPSWLTADALSVARAGLYLLIALAWAVGFFAWMLHLRWLAARIPDAEIIRKTHSYIWTLPLIYVLGTCLVIGPLVATIMHLVLLSRLIQQLSSICSAGKPLNLPGAR